MFVLPVLKDYPRWLVAGLAISVAGLTNAAVLWLVVPDAIFRGFGQLRFVYYALIVVAISVAIYLVSNRYPSQRLICIALSALSAYFASVIAYFIIAASSIERRVATGHWETLFAIFILPTHLIFIVAAVIAAVVIMVGLATLRLVSN